MACIIKRRSSKFGQIGPQSMELSALERLKHPHILIMGEMVFPPFLVCFGSDLFDTCR